MRHRLSRLRVSDEKTLGSLTPMVTEEIISVPELLLEMAKEPPVTVSPGLPLPFPEEITVTTAGVGIAVGVGATVGVAVDVGATLGVAVDVTVEVGLGVGGAAIN